MDHRELRKLVQLMNENELVELEVEQEGLRVCLRKAGARAPAYAAAPPPPAPVPAAPAPPAPEAVDPRLKVVRSPLVGTFYRRPGPDAEPYVDLGHVVEEETVVCVVEAMKVNNEIKAELGGEIVEVLVEDGQPVEYDQPLFRVRTGV